jgi:hypothetical protein
VGPNTTLAAIAFGGALGTVLSWISESAGAPMPPQVAAAVTTVIAIIFGWIVPPGRSNP